MYGKAGVGTSALVNSLLGYEVCDVENPNLHAVNGPRSECFTAHNTTVTVHKASTYHMYCGFGISVLRILNECKDVDLFLYCHDASSQFTHDDVETFHAVNRLLGESFWRRCVLVLTRSNMIHVPTHKENRENYKMLFTNTVNAFCHALIHERVPESIARDIPACAAGYSHGDEQRYIWYASDRAEASHERVDFLTELWLICLERMTEESQEVFLRFTEKRMKASTEQALVVKKIYKKIWKKVQSVSTERPHQKQLKEELSSIPHHAKGSDLRLTAEHYERLIILLQNTMPFSITTDLGAAFDTAVEPVAGPVRIAEGTTRRIDHKHDQLHLGICFLGDPFKGSVGRDGAVLSFPGVTLSIPPGAVTRDVDIFIWPCLSGPFLLPDGYELASPPYLIYPHIEFEKEVELKLEHFMNLESKEDCEEMTFISASKPVYDSGCTKYEFSVFRKVFLRWAARKLL